MVITTFGPTTVWKATAAIADGAFASAPVKLDHTYVTPAETHNPSSCTPPRRSGMARC